MSQLAYFINLPDDQDTFPLDTLPEEMPPVVTPAEPPKARTQLRAETQLSDIVRAVLPAMERHSDPSKAIAELDRVAVLFEVDPRMANKRMGAPWEVSWVLPQALVNARRSRGYTFELRVRGGATRLFIGFGPGEPSLVYAVADRKPANA